MSVLRVDNFLGRRIDLLGRIQQVPNASSAPVWPIFIVGGAAWPSGSSSAYVAYVVIETNDGQVMPLNSTWQFGALITATTMDNSWNLVSCDTAPWNNIANLPIVAEPYPCAAAQSFFGNKPLYARGQTFAGKLALSPGGTQLLTISAYGWVA
jgi:hypothetical protein